MKTRFFKSLSVLVWMLAGMNASAQDGASAETPSDQYRIGVDMQTGKLSVHAHLLQLSPSEICCLPAFGQRIGERLSQPRIVNAQNAEISVSMDDSGCFSVRESQKDLYIAYDLSIAELPEDRVWLASELSPLHRDQLIAFPGESLFIERHARETASAPYQTQIRILTNEQVVSTLPLNESESDTGSGLSFVAGDKYELVRSYWTFGKQRIVTASSGRMSFILSIADGWTFPVESIERELIQILDDYDKWIGRRTPEHISIYMFSAPHDADYRHGFARRGGLILQMGRYASSNAIARRILIAHELFHLYNGEGLQYEPDDYSATAWIREGMTQYLALKSLARIGLIRQNDINDWMGQSLERNQANASYRWGSSETAYHRGYFLSYAIDTQWALYQTNLSLEGFWQYLSESASWTQLHNNASIQKQLELYSTFDFSGFFKQYIYGQQAVPVKDILKISGLCTDNYKYTTNTAGLSYIYRPGDAYLYIDRIDANGAAKQAGLRVGDIIVPQKDTSWQDGRDKQLRVIRKDKQMQVRIPALNVIANGVKVGACVSGER